MNEDEINEFIFAEPFVPLRVHMVSGKTVNITRQGASMPLRNRLLVFRNLNRDGKGAEGYDVIAHLNIERIELLAIGKRNVAKRKPA